MNKKEKILYFVLICVAVTVLSSVSTYATNYLYNAGDVNYDNSNSGLKSDNVQTAMEELYAEATSYSDMRKMIYPVGSIYFSVTDDTVSKVQERFGGTWEVFGAGRTIIGVGTGTDSNSTNKTFAINETAGEYSHQLTKTEMPGHSHTGSTGGGITSNIRVVGAAGTTYASNHVCGYSSASYKDTGSSSNFPGANHYHNFTTSTEGGNGYHNNIQPYITVYMYKRTA